MSLRQAIAQIKSKSSFVAQIKQRLAWRRTQPKRAIRYYGEPIRHGSNTIEIERTHSYISYRSARAPKLFRISNEYMNLYDAVLRRANCYPDTEILGQREIVGIDMEKQADDRVIKKFRLQSEYSWITYRQMMNRIDSIANGLLAIGLKSNDNIVIFSETRPEWLISAMACLKIKVPVITLYSTLETKYEIFKLNLIEELEALSFGINQTNASFLIASDESLLKLKKIIHSCHKLQNVIVVKDKLGERTNKIELSNFIKLFTLDQVEQIGRTSETRVATYEKPKLNDLAFVMYTSGSTGQPKGVMLSHRNLLTAVESLMQRVEYVLPDETYIAYLPLAHVLELTSELSWLIHGIRIGYSSPSTLTDTSTGIRRGEPGDIRVLRPTAMFTVPLVLERIKKAVEERIERQGRLGQLVFQLAFDHKLNRIRQARQSSRLVDLIVFNRIKSLLGGRLSRLIVGGSILNSEVQKFGQVCIGTVIQAYGLTETCAAASTQLIHETQTGQVGSVVECCEIRLVDWVEGGYRVTDMPNPRGEIWVGGDHVSLGYFNMPDKTRQDFRLIDGVRFFATGDIGEMNADGNLVIIDRKKDIVKLQCGEYVSLNKVETCIKLSPLVDNCCVIADSNKSYCVCLVVPIEKQAIQYLAERRVERRGAGEQNALDFIANAFEVSETLRNELNNELFAHCSKHGLKRFEVPTRFKVVREVWLPGSGLVTDSLKLKRREIEKFYRSQIKSLYS